MLHDVVLSTKQYYSTEIMERKGNDNVNKSNHHNGSGNGNNVGASSVGGAGGGGICYTQYIKRIIYNTARIIYNQWI